MMRKLIFAAGLLLPLPAIAQSSSSSGGYTLGGIPTVPTAAVGTNTNQIATTAFVLANSGTGASGTTTGTTPTTNMSASTVALPGLASRTLAAREADIYNVRDYGALGTNTATTVLTQFPSSATASLAAFASQSVGGVTPYSWMTNPAFGLTFSMQTTTDHGGAGTSLSFLQPATGINNWSATVATWQVPGNERDLVQVGMQVSGSCIATNTTVSAVGRTPGSSTYGSITLSQSTTGDCASGTSITFTIAPAQLQALTVDWLGIQGAMAAAWQNLTSGGTVYMPAGTYILNHSLINAGGVVDSNFELPNLDVRGDGVAETRLTFPSDLGSDNCAVLSGGRGVGLTSLSTYHDFRIIGPSYTRTNGAMPNHMDGLCVGEDDRLYGLSISAMRAGVNGVKDHWTVHDSTLSNNGYGIYFAPYSSTIGNQLVENSNLGGNTIASFGVATTNAIDSSLITNVHTGFEPYGFYYEANGSNVTNGLGILLTNSTLTNVYIEAVGNGWIYGNAESGIVMRNSFINGGPADVGSQKNYAIPASSGGTLPAPAVVYVNEFQGNTMLGTEWAPYNSVTDAIVETGDRTTGNVWINDVSFISNSTASVSPIKAAGGMNNNTFHSPWGSGTFWRSGAAMNAGVPVYDAGSFVALPYIDGRGFLGTTASPVGQNGTVAVIESTDYANIAKSDPTQAISSGQPIFATTGGVSGGLDQSGAIGIAVAASPSGTATVYVDLDLASKAGATGAATKLSSSGATQATASQLARTVDEFTTVPAGSGAILGVVPVGQAIYVYNDGANSLIVYPQTGAQIGSAAANAGVLIPAGGSGSFRRISTTLWHQ